MERTIANSNYLKKCLENFANGFWRRVSSSPWWQLVSNWLTKIHQSVTLGWSVGKTNVKVAYNEALTNGRVFVGLVLLVGVAPSLYWAHLFFDYRVVIPGWHYKNMFFWLFTNREEFFFGIGLTGFFLLLPQKLGYRYLLVPFIATCACEVIYQSLQISHWTHFYRPLWSHERAWEPAIVIVLTVYALIKVMNYLVYKKYHQKDGNVGRVFGIIRAPGIDRDRKMDILENLSEESFNYNNRI